MGVAQFPWVIFVDALAARVEKILSQATNKAGVFIDSKGPTLQGIRPAQGRTMPSPLDRRPTAWGGREKLDSVLVFSQ